MTLLDRFSLFSPLDLFALLVLFFGWSAMGWWIEHPSSKHRPLLD